MKISDSLTAIAPALVKASAEIKAVVKDRVNPHFKSTYASLDAIMDAIRPILSKHGLALVQGTAEAFHDPEAGRLVGITVETMLIHVSGEYLKSSVVMPIGKADPQGAGAAMSYGRRYGVSAMLSLATEDDDDGNSAMPVRPAAAAPQAHPQAQPQAQPQRPAAPRSRGGEPETVGAIVDEALRRHNAPADGAAPSCPVCGGGMWDNRPKKAAGEMNPKAPDFKCKRKGECEGVIWPSKDGGSRKPAARTAPVTDPDGFDVDAYAPDSADLPF